MADNFGDPAGGPSAETIGAVKVEIEGDFSQLGADFDAAVAMAVSKGATLKEAIEQALAVPDTAPITQALENVGTAADEAGARVGGFAGTLREIFAGLGDNLEGLHENFVEFGEGVSQALEHPIQQFRALVEAIGPVGIGLAAIGAAVYEVTEKLSEFVLEEGQAARNTENFAEKLGLSFEEAKQLGEMASVVSVNIDGLARVSTVLAQALEDPDGSPKAAKTAAALHDMGIEANTAGEAMLQLLQHLAGIEDPTERLAEAATVIPARMVASLQPLLGNFDHLKEAIESLGGELDTNMVHGLLAANEQSKLLGIAWDHLKESVAATFAPAITDGLKLLTQLLVEIQRVDWSTIASMATALNPVLGALVNYFQPNPALPMAVPLHPEQPAAALPPPPDYSAALYAAYSQLGVANFSSLTHAQTTESGDLTKFSDLGAFNAIADRLDDGRLLQAADNLEAKLQEAFHAGAISADQFNTSVQHIEDTVADAAQRVSDALPKAFKGFDMHAFIATLDDDFSTLSDSLLKSGSMAGDWAVKMNAARDSMKQFMDSTGTAFTTALPALDGLAGALQKLKIDSDESGLALKQSLGVLNTVLESDDATLSQVEAAWSKFGTTISKLSKTDLPAAISEYDKYVEALKNTDAPIGQILEAQQKELQVEIQLKQLRGEDTTAEIENLTRLQYQIKALHDESARLGDIYVSLRKDFDNVFSSLSKGLADAIVNGKNLGDVFINVGKQIATSILDTVIKGALVPLQDELNKTNGLFDTLAKSITGLFGKGGGGAGAAGALAGSGEAGAESSGMLGGVAQGAGAGSGEAGGAAGSAAGSAGGGAGAAGSLLGTVASVASVVGAVAQVASGIVQGFQMAHLENLTGEIEVTTRKIFNVVGGNYMDSIYGYTMQTWQQLNVMTGELSDLHDALVDIDSKMDVLIAAVEAGGGGGGNGSGGPGGGQALIDALQKSNQILSDLSDAFNSLAGTVRGLGLGGGAQTASFTTGGAGGLGAYNLNSAVSATGSFGPIASQLDLLNQAQSATAVAAPGAVGPPITAGTAMDWWMNNNIASTGGGAAFPGLQNNWLSYPGFWQLVDQVASAHHETQDQAYAEVYNQLRTGTPFDDIPTLLGLTPNFPIASPSAPPQGPQPTTPTPNVPVFGGYQGPPGGSIPITVNALNPSSRGVADGIVQSLRQIGVKV